MIVIGHQSIGGYLNGEDLRQCQNALFEPASPVFVALAGHRVRTTKKGAANAARNTMVVGGGFNRDLLFAGLWHGRTPSLKLSNPIMACELENGIRQKYQLEWVSKLWRSNGS